MAKSFIRILGGIAAGIVAALLLLELLLRVLPVQEGLYAADFSGDWPIERMQGPAGYTYSTDWNFNNVRHGRINSLGYPAPFEFTPGGRHVAVVGDSFIAGTMNDYSESLQAQLQALIPREQVVLGLGLSGASLPDYVAMSRLAAGRFKPEWLVLLVVPGDFVEGFRTEPGHYHWSATGPDGVELTPDARRRNALRLWVRTLATVRYVKAHIGVTAPDLLLPAKPAAPAAHSGGCQPVGLAPDDPVIVERLVGALSHASGVPNDHIVMLFDPDIHPGSDTLRGGGRSRCQTRDNSARSLLAQSAAQGGIHVIDMKPVFDAFHARTGQRIDYADSHWNALGHGLAAAQVARIMNGAGKAGQ